MNKQRIETQKNPAAMQIVLTGYVQGLGVRPAISQLAQQLQLTGSVSNQTDGVHIFVEGDEDNLDQFQDKLIGILPAQARVDQFLSQTVSPREDKSFIIQKYEQSQSSHAGPLSTSVPVDLGICSHCLQESKNPANRRYQDLFISCTDCGPRYSIIKKMPYERAETAMDRFEMCPACKTEYQHSENRRFHAQTISCPTCGPKAWAADQSGNQMAENMDAIRLICKKLDAGRIVAIRGLGGYQLLADATSDQAVRVLRQRKRRQGKPLAVMVADIKQAEDLATISSAERELLCSPANPIVLLRRKAKTPIASAVPQLHTLGMMLPGSSLHYWIATLFEKPLVVTSGNIEGEPLAVDVKQAEEKLHNVADYFLHHDRPILNAVDDSVMQVVASRSTTIRLARGLAPLSLPVQTTEHLFAAGSHQKNTIAFSNSQQAALSPHIGDLDSLLMRDNYNSTVHRFNTIYGVQSPKYIHDLHPDYYSTRFAQQGSENKTEGVQHHHAHVVSGMIEHELLDQKVLGIAFDGTGWGTEGTIWGGEFLLTTKQEFERVAHVQPFWLSGAEAAINNPWRIAASLLHASLGKKKAISITRQIFQNRKEEELKTVCHTIEKKTFGLPTTSVGRLFDGVAAIILGTESVCYEGQLAMLLESCVNNEESGEYDFDIDTNGRIIELNWQRAIRQIVDDYESDVSQNIMASRFHRGLASGVCRVCEHFPEYPVVLSGGCFQNRVLVELLVEKFDRISRKVFFPETIPMNDGGLAAGQLVIGAAQNL